MKFGLSKTMIERNDESGEENTKWWMERFL